MMFIWLLLEPLLRPLVKPALLAAGLLAVGSALGLPVADAAITFVVDTTTWAFWTFWNWALDVITEQVIDRVNPFSIAFRVPQTAG